MKNLRSFFSARETPFYYYDLELLDATLKALSSANRYGYHVHYALKANNNTPILERIKKAGLGVDCVSGNEVKIGLEHGFKSSNIVLAGVGKTDKEIGYAIDQNIFSFNVESIQELEVIDEIAGKKGKKANVSIRINPAIEAGTHHYITTGAKGNKFGISGEQLLESLDLLKSLSNVHFIGLHYHIGSQITDLNRFKNLCERVNHLQKELLNAGFSLPHLNVGGGLGIDYENPQEHPIPDFESYFRVFHEHLTLLPDQEVHFELGRSIVGQCGTLVTRALYLKESDHSNFLILDAGMTDLMRPALYQASHKIVSLSEAQNTRQYDVVGPICESSDAFGKAITLPETKRGDILMICSAGAYGETMKNSYNARDLAPAYYSE
ncbi:diaminopimelate decarboxylase [Marinoscillum sp. 108]|uniref:diaminopimelate decarboxylase n=1 Tax=Marinoscillum sp. 108 TaxID=2653151 RepID=UPI0012EFD2E6|nr:diaminopimelate decarboxylase [Marinoscillum sp. 108]VXD11420.1 Diaminopimelate decarboxylase [Marinoscillum sp. 108]